jgi:pimeloyl-ACP methyl ester carboxylesterase
MAAMIPTAQLESLAGTGHFAMWEKPDESNRTILEFLRSSQQ